MIIAIDLQEMLFVVYWFCFIIYIKMCEHKKGKRETGGKDYAPYKT